MKHHWRWPQSYNLEHLALSLLLRAYDMHFLHWVSHHLTRPVSPIGSTKIRLQETP